MKPSARAEAAYPGVEDSRGKTHADRVEGGELLVRALAERGVTRIFSVSGGPLNPAYAATARHGVQLVHVRHECAAAFMADAAARLTGIPGVALVTLGPGVTNTLTGAATALLAGVPILIVGAQTARGQLDKGAGMSFNTLPAMAPVTKWAAQIVDASRIPEYVDEAWRRMTSGRPGPVYLEIPSDVMSEVAPLPAPRRALKQAGPGADRCLVEEALAALERARRPLLLIGDDVHHSRAERLLPGFVEGCQLPFATLRLARGAMDETHELCIGPGYTPANPVLRRALGEADVIFLLGHHWEFDLDFGRLCNPEAILVQVYPDGHYLGRGTPVHVAIEATACSFLAAAQGAARPAWRDEEWVASITAAWRAHQKEAIDSAAAEFDGLMHPLHLLREVVAAAPEDTLYVTSHGNVDFWFDPYLPVRAPGRYLRAGQSGALGAEIPYGIAAKMCRPESPVIVFVGDGGFGYHAFELETAVRYGAPVLVIVADDGKWGAIAHPQRRRYGMEVAMDLPRRELSQVMRALGGWGESVREPEEVGPAVQRALASNLPAVLHVPVASKESPYIHYISN